LNKQERIQQLWLSGETVGSIALQVELSILEVVGILASQNYYEEASKEDKGVQ
jgi:hypothetical protein